MFANFESLFKALLEGTQPEVVSLVHGSRLLPPEVNCAWPLHTILGHDAVTFALPEQQERGIGLHKGAVFPNPPRQLSSARPTVALKANAHARVGQSSSMRTASGTDAGKCNAESARLNNVFPAVEPNGGSARPTGTPILMACLQLRPNHPGSRPPPDAIFSGQSSVRGAKTSSISRSDVA